MDGRCNISVIPEFLPKMFGPELVQGVSAVQIHLGILTGR
jgi:hypothetical protein